MRTPGTGRAAILFTLLTAVVLLSAKEPFQEVVDHVDLEKFAGDWYVIALMPSIIEKNAVNGIETYTFEGGDKVHVRYVFYKGSPEGRKKVTTQRGWIIDTENNAEWKVQPLWPFRLPYLVIDLADDYRYTVIGTNNYKYLWIMAREPYLSPGDYEGILSRLDARGYDIEDIQIMPQEWE